ncbi:uncharacterized protein LOC124168543 [Ischnura elegans]|uniref:uncharacterized protein LOC124168543 n=1 Tax=Ischnura elegans TaxID=197161 RepID=UPI001ED88B38|nr:uncharacterized protein LOC124168543 [Ischnura elegans]
MFGQSGPKRTQTSFISSNIGNQEMTYHNGGWNNNPGAIFPSPRSSGCGYNSLKPDYGNLSTQDINWNNQPAQGSWHGQPNPGPWNNQPTPGPWNNQPTQGSWNDKPCQEMWNNQPNRGSWNMRNHGRASMRGPLSRGGRGMRARGYGGVSGTNRSQPSGGGDHYCDSCERGFSTPEDLANHQKNDHVVCGLEGCTLSAHPKIVEKHQRMQHDSGLYSRLAAASSQNPDDVQKWINERKRNYPTKENIERRKQETEDCLRRGEPLGLMPESRFGRYRGRGHASRGRGQLQREHVSNRGRGSSRELHKRKFDVRGGRHQRKAKSSQKRLKDVEITPENVEDDEPRDIPMFRGTAQLLGMALDEAPSSDEELVDVSGSFSDSEWLVEEGLAEAETTPTENGDKKVDHIEGKKVVEVVSKAITLNNSLGALMGSYASDDSDEDAPPVEQKIRVSKGKLLCDVEMKGEKKNVNQNPPKAEIDAIQPKPVVAEAVAEVDGAEESDGSAPEVVPIVKVEEERGAGLVEGPGETSKLEEKDEGDSGKKVRRGRKRTRGHKGNTEVPKDGEDEVEKSSAKDVKKPYVKPYVKPARHPTLLEELLKHEIRHERNVILQCIRHIVQSNFFDKKTVLQSAKDESASNGEISSKGDERSCALSAKDESASNGEISSKGYESCCATSAKDESVSNEEISSKEDESCCATSAKDESVSNGEISSNGDENSCAI